MTAIEGINEHPIPYWYDPKMFEDAKEYCLKHAEYTITDIFEHLHANRSRYNFRPTYADAAQAVFYLMDTVKEIPIREVHG